MLSRQPFINRILLLGIFILVASGCSSVQRSADQDAEVDDATVNNDPWEGMNRKIFAFNDTMDRYLLKPAAKGYRVVTPDVAETGITNFFDNLMEIRNIINDVLQWNWGQAGNDTGRFLINSTLGIGGIFDVARHMTLEKSEGEDFGQTFGVWGFDQGPYLVLPFLGSSTVRDGVGVPLNWYTNPLGYIDHVPTRNSSQAFKFIVDRANLLDAEGFVSGDRYTFIREAYLQRRQYLIGGDEGGDDGDPFGEDGFGMDDDEFGE